MARLPFAFEEKGRATATPDHHPSLRKSIYGILYDGAIFSEASVLIQIIVIERYVNQAEPSSLPIARTRRGQPMQRVRGQEGNSSKRMWFAGVIACTVAHEE
eukprot:scaffold27511_cov32-Tisochrysis_lutea.AAC.2